MRLLWQPPKIQRLTQSLVITSCFHWDLDLPIAHEKNDPWIQQYTIHDPQHTNPLSNAS